jgi:hypothetical protein
MRIFLAALLAASSLPVPRRFCSTIGSVPPTVPLPLGRARACPTARADVAASVTRQIEHGSAQRRAHRVCTSRWRSGLVSSAMKSHLKVAANLFGSLPRINMSNVPERCLDLARRRSERSPMLAFTSIAIVMVFVQVPQTRADDLAIGDQLTLSELVQPDRFGWPALFTCKRQPGDKHPVVVSAKDPDEMNERLVAAGIWPEDCYGGFSFRSTRPHPGKLSEIKGQVERTPRPMRASDPAKAPATHVSG